MPIDGSVGSFLQVDSGFLTKAFLVLFLIFYSVFALILFRQIQIMNKKLPTALSPILRFVGIIHLGVTLAITFFVVGSF